MASDADERRKGYSSGCGRGGHWPRKGVADSSARRRSNSATGIGRGFAAVVVADHKVDDAVSDAPTLDEGRRALSVDFAASSEVLQRRMQEIVDDELAQERARQVEDLNSKVSALEKDRERARDELQRTERQYKHLIHEAKEQLAQVQAEQQTTRQEVELLQRQLRDSGQRRAAQTSKQEQGIAEEAARAEAEVRRLSQLHREHEQQLEHTSAEVVELQGTVDELERRRFETHEGSLQISVATQSLRDSLEEAKKRLADSEERRAVLRERYINFGHQFEQTVDRSEKESQALLAELQDDLSHAQKKQEKYKLRFEGLESEIHSAESALQLQKESIEDKGAEISRLQRVLDGEREAGTKQELRYLQCQQQEFAPDLQQRVPVATHQKLLEEQARQFRERMQDLERKLKLEMQASVPIADLGTSAPSGGRPPIAEWKPPSPRPSSLGIHAPPARRALSRAAQKDAAKRANLRAEALEQELRDWRQSHRRVEAEVAKKEEQRRTFNDSVQEANSHLVRLQRIVDNERNAEEAAQSETKEVKTEIATAEADLSSSTSRIRSMKGDMAEYRRLGVALDEAKHSLGTLEESRERWRQECHGNKLELSALECESRNLMSQMQSAERQAERLEEQHRRDAMKLRRFYELMTRMQYLAKASMKEARSRVDQLRWDATSELNELRQRCQDLAHQFEFVWEGQKQRVCSEQTVLERAGEDARRRSQYMEQQIDLCNAEAQDLEARLQSVRNEQLEEEAIKAMLQDAAVSQNRSFERILNVLSAALPCATALDRSTSRMVSAGVAEATGIPDVLTALQEGLEAAHEQARVSAVATARQRTETQFEIDARRSASAAVSRQSELAVEVASAESRRDLLACEIRRQRAGLLSRRERCVKRSAEMMSEIGVLESSLQAIQHKEQTLHEEEGTLSRQMQTLQIEASLSLELSKTDCAEHLKPLKEHLYELLSEVEELQKSYQCELREVERSGSAKCTEFAEESDEETRLLKERFAEESEVLRRELAVARVAEGETFDAIDKQANDMRERLAEHSADLDGVRMSCRQMHGLSEMALDEQQASQRSVQDADARLTQAQQTRHREQENIAERRSEILRRHERDVSELRRAKDAEMLSLRTRLQQSLSGLSAVSVDGEDMSIASAIGANVFDTSAVVATPESPATERLVARALHNLGGATPSP